MASDGSGDELSAGDGIGGGVARAALASLESAALNAVGNSLPRFSARLKIPAAALGLKKNLAGTPPTRTSCKDEDPSPSLGHSEVSAVQHSPGEVVKPELGQRREKDGEISSAVRGKKSGYVLNEEPSPIGEKSVCASGELEEEAGAVACEPSPSASDGEVLAGEPSTEKVNAGHGAPTVVPMRIVPISSSRGLSIISSDQPHVSHVLVHRHSRPVPSQHGPPIGVGLAEEDVSHPGSGESEVHPSGS